MSHARSSRAENGCYINDTVLSILELLKTFERVLYINLSGVHCDGVEEAFYTSNRVMTISFHLKPGIDGPATGDLGDIGADQGEGFALNVPLEPGLESDMLVATFKSIVNKARNVFSPNAIVLQCGAALLSGERGGQFNVMCSAYGECLKLVRDFNLPLLLLGGCGTSLSNTARLWAYLTAVCLGMEAGMPDVVPENSEYREYFGPDYKTMAPKIDMPSFNTAKSIQSLRRKVMSHLDKIKKK
mmetsp:Transcript_1762/g.2886  ORF Transcript_1762/g.2886 Transcript_1762/m.2886 type:complete len:243 (-) Transcript_1762:23-751(-)